MPEKFIGAAVSIIMLVLVTQALFPGLLAQIATATAYGIIAAFALVIVGAVIWLLFRLADGSGL